MSGEPPANYNPNESLLQGGDKVPIVPVQGGGGDGTSVPPNFNPNESLLHGGDTAPIIAVQGGGQQEGGVKGQPRPVSPLSTINESGNEENNAESKRSEDEENEVGSELGSEDEEEGKRMKTLGKMKKMMTYSENEEESNEEDEEDEEDEEEDEVGSEDEEPKNENKPQEETFDRYVDPSIQTGTRVKQLTLRGREFILRKPQQRLLSKAAPEDSTLENWKALKFTSEEVDFLNELQLSPKLLYETFHPLGKSWKTELSNFLYFLTVKLCYPAIHVITAADCQEAREFMSLVSAKHYSNLIKQLSLESKPLAGEVNLPELPPAYNEDEPPINEKKNTRAYLDRITKKMDAIPLDTRSTFGKAKNFIKGLFKSKEEVEEEEEAALESDVDLMRGVSGEGQEEAEVSTTARGKKPKAAKEQAPTAEPEAVVAVVSSKPPRKVYSAEELEEAPWLAFEGTDMTPGSQEYAELFRTPEGTTYAAFVGVPEAERTKDLWEAILAVRRQRA